MYIVLNGLVDLRVVLNTAYNITSATYKVWMSGRGVGMVEEEGGWVNDASRHSQPSCVHSEARQIATAALTIPQGEQTSSGTAWDHRLSY